MNSKAGTLKTNSKKIDANAFDRSRNQERVVIENVSPCINNGEFAIKTVAGQNVHFEADILCDGHDVLRAELLITPSKGKKSEIHAMTVQGNDRWQADFALNEEGNFNYQIRAWVDWPLTWLFGTRKKLADNQDISSELLEGAVYLEAVVALLPKTKSKNPTAWKTLFEYKNKHNKAKEILVSQELETLFFDNPTREFAASTPLLPWRVERRKALFSTWYEFFPRSAGKDENHGTFKDCENLLPRVAEMGFDTLYFPPVHPIGEVNRKGKNNATTAQEGDVGSPWGIGSFHGGHMSLHPDLGDEKAFKSLVKKAKDLGIEIAMDFALQAAPDHPWVKSNPQWFKWRPDGTVQYAENPPKKYQDILPIYFETEDWQNLWNELLKSALYWVEKFDIRVFRVDNPHTKPFEFWGWLMQNVQAKHPDVIFLSEAFTRPKIMEQLAKQGFTQGYTYFTWRNTKDEIIQYINELTKTDRQYYFRPNFWPNTPDINPFHLQGANESMHLQRYALAATMSSNVGLYGPVYEFMESQAIPGREEYADSEKYQIRTWDWAKRTRIMEIMTLINKARHELPALQQTNNIEFLEIDNPQIIAFHKWSLDGQNKALVVISLDQHYAQKGWVKVPLNHWGIHEGHNVRVIDQITGDSYNWDKEWCYVELHPVLPFHIFEVKL